MLILQEDSDLMDIFEDGFLDEDGNDMRVLSPTNTVDLNALTLFWRPPTPNNQRPIVDQILVSPVEEKITYRSECTLPSWSGLIAPLLKTMTFIMLQHTRLSWVA
jgi:hypothetical protein